MMDFTSTFWVNKLLDNYPEATLKLHTAGGTVAWFLDWRHGSMSFQGGTEQTARATAALFIHLFKQGVDCGLARDLACSYFDPRIGRGKLCR